MKTKYPFRSFAMLMLSLLFFGSCELQESVLKENNIIEKQIDFSDASERLLNEESKSDNTISLSTFNSWKSSWEAHWNDNYISNFTMPLSNLQNLINTPDVSEAQFHLGYSESDGKPHLILVGVNAAGESMIGANDHFYNFTRPCPDLCPESLNDDIVFPPTGLDDEPTNTISKATFDAWNTSWESHWDDNYIESFTMPLSNLENLVRTNDVAEARLYLGYSEEDDQAHLTLVGVDADGQSMIGVNAYIYDTSRPCPPFCKPRKPNN